MKLQIYGPRHSRVVMSHLRIHIIDRLVRGCNSRNTIEMLALHIIDMICMLTWGILERQTRLPILTAILVTEKEGQEKIMPGWNWAKAHVTCKTLLVLYENRTSIRNDSSWERYGHGDPCTRFYNAWVYNLPIWSLASKTCTVVVHWFQPMKKTDLWEWEWVKWSCRSYESHCFGLGKIPKQLNFRCLLYWTMSSQRYCKTQDNIRSQTTTI